MGPGRRVDFFVEQAICLGIHWRYGWESDFTFELSISILCFSVVFGFGKKKSD